MTKVCNDCGIAKPVSSFEKYRGKCWTCRDRAKRARTRPPPTAKPAKVKVPPKVFRRELREAKRYIVTSAQNATPVHADFLAALEVAAEYLDAELVVIPLRYKNPTRANERTDDDWWDAAVVPYLYDGRTHLHRHLILVADVKTQPTATSPLSGFESMTGHESCIIGHPQLEFKTVAVPSQKFPKILTTTGAVTERNYSDTRAGKVGEFHHHLGAVMVEVGPKRFHIRQINADRDDGSFIDLWPHRHYCAAGVSLAPAALGLVCGDLHERFVDPDVDRATFGPGGIVETSNAGTVVLHDVVDGDAPNPHHKGHPFLQLAKVEAKRHRVLDELVSLVDFVNDRVRGRQAVIVDSNHHDFISRWMDAVEWRADLENAEFFFETGLHMVRNAKASVQGAPYVGPFAYWCERLGLGSNIRLLGSNESCLLADIECGMHGHRGVNGSKGSALAFSRVGDKTITGHAHSPRILKGAYVVGTSTPLRLEYTHGPSTWLNTHCIVYGNGKRSLISIIDGDWHEPWTAAENDPALPPRVG